MQKRFNLLPPQTQEYVTQMMTPEIVQLLGILGGQETLSFFSRIENKEMALVPVLRSEIQGLDEGELPEESDTSDTNQESGTTTPPERLAF